MRTLFIIMMVTSALMAQLKVGDIPSNVIIEVKDGGYLSGKPFDSSVLRGKISIILYADPDEQSKGETLAEKLDELVKELASLYLQKYMIINLDDTWKPDFVIMKLLKSRQVDHPQSIYIIDRSSILSRAWGLEHDAFVCVILDSFGKVIYEGKGKFSGQEIEKIMNLIKKSVDSLPK